MILRLHPLFTAQLLLCAALILSTQSVLAASSALTMQIRDVYTGYGVATHVEIKHDQHLIQALETGTSGKASVVLPQGQYQITLTASGYEAMDFSTTVLETEMPNYFPLMHPVALPKEMQAETQKQKTPRMASLKPTALFRGYVIDEASGQPLSGVLVQAQAAKSSVTTDARGYFALELPFVPNARIARENLVFSLSGYTSFQRTHIPVTEDGAAYSIQLHTGKGVEIYRETHRLDDIESTLQSSQAKMSLPRLPKAAQLNVTPLFANPLPNITPAITIRVGTDCRTSITCSSVAPVYPMKLEDYVASGVTKEWFNSWSLTSIEAGAVAYRSYAVYFINHPKTATYDICNTTACQAWHPGSIPTTKGLQAMQKTRGFMLTNSTGATAIKSEYSAVNNDLANAGYCYKNSKKTLTPTSMTEFCTIEEVNNQTCVCQVNAKVPKDWKASIGCGDGSSGKPKENWWCLTDDVLKGQPRAGHGRGMSQVGSKLWAAQGKPWSWILWHYYKEKRQAPSLAVAGAVDRTPYAVISSPVNTSIATPVFFGGDLTKRNLSWKVKNLNSDVLSGLLVRAVYRGSSPELVLSPVTNNVLKLAAGESILTQAFTLPANAPMNVSYDVELWLDANDSKQVEVTEDLLLGQRSVLLSPPLQYIKIANNGKELPDSTVLGLGANDWACTKDTKTGLIWEVKTDDDGLRDKDNTYSWYDPNPATNGGFSGFQSNGDGGLGSCTGGILCNTNAYKNAVNTKKLCGYGGWIVPTIEQLLGLVHSSNNPRINTIYFPNTLASWVWSSLPYAEGRGEAWIVDFQYGYDFMDLKGNSNAVRLVRGGQ